MRFILNPTDFFQRFSKHNEIIFDLDNTIYDENIFLEQSYSKIANILENYTDVSRHDIHKYLWNFFLKNGRANIFNELIQNFDFSKKVDIDFILSIFRSRDNNIKLKAFNYFSSYINSINSLEEKNYFIITNGNHIQQKNKFYYLRSSLLKTPKTIIYANEHKPKPSDESFKILNKRFKFKNPIYIGDSLIDKQFSINSSVDYAGLVFQRNKFGLVDESTIMINY